MPDDPRKLLDAIEDQLVRADLVVTTGGVSAGAYDVVKEVLSPARHGRRSTKVAMQPGMPQGFGTVGPDATPIFTLPGNPVSAYVSFEVFVRPAIRRMLGVEPLLPADGARGAAPRRCTRRAGKRQFVRGWLASRTVAYVVRPVGGAGLAPGQRPRRTPTALIVVPEDDHRGAGRRHACTVMVLERRLS